MHFPTSVLKYNNKPELCLNWPLLLISYTEDINFRPCYCDFRNEQMLVSERFHLHTYVAHSITKRIANIINVAQIMMWKHLLRRYTTIRFVVLVFVVKLTEMPSKPLIYQVLYHC